MRGIHTQRNDWPAERVDQLRVLYAGGMSSSQIASELGGLTKNAVVGKVHRLGLYRTSSAPNPSIAIGPTVSKQADGGLVEKVRFGVQARKALADKDRGTTQRIAKVKTFKQRKRGAAPGGFLGIALVDLEDGQCRFPRGDGPFLFCGQPALAGESYCPDCFRVCYSPYPRRDNGPAPTNYAGPGRGTAWA